MSDYKKPFAQLASLLPSNLKNPLNESLLSNLFDKQLTHEEATKVFGLIGKYYADSKESRPWVDQPNLERQFNMLLPIIYAHHGTDEHTFSFNDIINKARALGVNIDDMENWSRQQSFNFAPPIDIDKFVNFNRYYWVENSSTEQALPWNPAHQPEYYVIKRPSFTGKLKMPVTVATVGNIALNGTGKPHETWSVVFSSAYQYKVFGSISGIIGNGKIINGHSTFSKIPLSFNIQADDEHPFTSGDTFVINVKQLATLPAEVSFTGNGKGYVYGVKGKLPFATVDGILLEPGIRILVKNQLDHSQNGIYIVAAGDWTIAPDSEISGLQSGIETYVKRGSQTGTWSSTDLISFTKISAEPTINSWQSSNYWVHADDLVSLAQITASAATQAIRPIIEYSDGLELVSHSKSRFNQAPLFKLYWLDGTATSWVSPLFYYEEDTNAPIDVALQRRVKIDTNSDFSFGQGTLSADGKILAFKDSDVLKTMWSPGPSTPQLSDISFTGLGNGQLTQLTPLSAALSETWTLTALSPTIFSVYGSRAGKLANVDISSGISNKWFTAVIQSGSTPFLEGDSFTFTVSAEESIRYTKADSSVMPVSFDAHPSTDLNKEGCWLTPPHLLLNGELENRAEIKYGDLVDHFISVEQNQHYFKGSAFGRNNFRTQTPDLGLGGSIKVVNGQFNLFASMMMQKDVSPLSLIDFAEKQYDIAINSISDFVTVNAFDLLTRGVIDASNILVEYETYYAARPDLLQSFRDSTSPIKNWPLTLPLMGIIPAVQPQFGLDFELNAYVLQHHDGHYSPVATQDFQFEMGLATEVTTRYDGNSSTGHIGATAPSAPYKNQLWFNTQTNQLNICTLTFEGVHIPLTAQVNDLWFNRVASELKKWDGHSWVTETQFPWSVVLVSDLINSTMLNAEQKLFDYCSINNTFGKAQHSLNLLERALDPIFLEYELSKFAIANNQNPTATDFSQTDAFTWNYSEISIPVDGLTVSITAPRWHEIYKQYFLLKTGIATSRPDIMPWNLFGFQSKPISWTYDNAIQISDLDSTLQLPFVVTITQNNVDVSSPVSAIEGINLSAGDRVLLVGQTNISENGLYAKSGSSLYKIPVANGNYVTVSEGIYRNSFWTYTGITFEQARQWKQEMWTDLLALDPTLKTCVNIYTDVLLAPYTDANPQSLLNATSNINISGIAKGYSFGDKGPVELVWQHSNSYNYALLRAYFKMSPLSVLSTYWGFQTQTVAGLPINRLDGKLLSHTNFSLHSEPKLATVEATPLITGTASSPFTQQEFYLTAIYQQSDETILFTNRELGLAVSVNENNFASTPYSALAINLAENGSPFTIGDKIKVSILDTQVSCEFIPATSVTYNGLNQLYSQYLKYNGFSAEISDNITLLRDWTIKLGYRVGGLIENDTLLIKNDVFGTIPDTAYDVKLKINPIAQNFWVHGLHIRVLSIGESQFIGKDASGTDLYVPNPVGSTVQIGRNPQNGDPVFRASDAGRDWVFMIENYLSAHPQIEKFTLDTTDVYQTFNALSKSHSADEWRNYETITGVEIVNLPVTITGIQNVVNFLQGYILKLEADGWAFGQGDYPDVDTQTGRTVNWQLEVEKFIDNLYKGANSNSTFSLNPMTKAFWFNTPTGLVAPFEISKFQDLTTTQFAYDVLGDAIITSGLSVIRTDSQTEVHGDVPMFGAHININEYEHLILFNKYVSSVGGLIFDPFLGATIEKMLVSGKKQSNFTLRPSFGGFFLNNGVFSKNIAASVDDVANYYNPTKVFDSVDSTHHSLALLGFSKKSYFKLIEADPKTEFNFWRGLIGAKGTNFAIDAFLNSSKFEYAQLDEFWAYKLAEYGDARQHTFPEIKLNTVDCTLKHTRLYFSEDVSDVAPSTYISIDPAEEARWYSIIDLNTKLFFEPEYAIETITTTGANQIVQVMPFDFAELGNNALKINNSTIKVTTPGTYEFRFARPAKPKFSPIKLIDYKDQAFIQDITTWHPAFDNHASAAFEAINTIAEADPAKYNYSTLIVGNSQYDPSRIWGDREVGQTWWDISTRAYIPYYDSTIFPSFEERLARWGSLAEYASIDVYEWVSSDVPPQQYNDIAKKEQTSADIPAEQKKSGTVAKKKAYKRSRSWVARPVAWSYLPTPASAPTIMPGVDLSGNPALSSDPLSTQADVAQALKRATTSIHLADTLVGQSAAVLEHGTYDMYGLTSGMHVAGWSINKPYGELVLSNTFGYLLGSTDNIGEDVVTFSGIDIFSYVALTWSDNPSYKGAVVGKITFAISDQGGVYYITATEVGSGKTSSQTFTSYSGLIGDIFEISFDSFGLKLVGALEVASATQEEIAAELSVLDLEAYIRNYNLANVTIPFPTNVLDNSLPIDLPITYSESVSVDGLHLFSSVTFAKTSSATVGLYRIKSEYHNNQYFVSLYKDDALTPVASLLVTTIFNSSIQGNTIVSPTFNFGPITVATTLLTSSFRNGNNTVSGASFPISPLYGDYFYINTGLSRGFYTFDGTAWVPADVNLAINPDILVDAADIASELEYLGTIMVGMDALTGNVSIQNSTALFADDFGWRAWAEPTQDDLNSDNATPLNNWTPIYGDWTSVPSTREALKVVADYNSAPLKLKDSNAVDVNNNQDTFRNIVSSSPLSVSDTTVEKYKSVWGPWELIKPEIQRAIGHDAIIDFTFNSRVLAKTFSIYLDGINQLPSFYKINTSATNKVSTSTVIPAGREVVAILPAYEPSVTDLEFNPDIKDDPKINVQYKTDYEYVSTNVRDASGNITGQHYYFWVKDKTIPVKNRLISSQQAAQLLRDGPSAYMTFQNLVTGVDELTRYKGITIAGLNSLITKDNTFKIRFTQDLTLRDDPNQIDLKNVHTEWTLIRPNQREKIPLTLWSKLVDSACGKNIAGDNLPSLARAAYDDRNLTSTRYGFGPDQVLAERSLIIASLTNTILNPKTEEYKKGGSIPLIIQGIDRSAYTQWFATPESSRKIMEFIWKTATPAQINELFFEVLQDALANNYEFSDIFKTSRLSAHSIITVDPSFQSNNTSIYY